MQEISLFKNIYHNDNGEIININEFLHKVKYGHWSKVVSQVRESKSKEERAEKKKQLPYVTISGKFQRRKKSDLIKHSGFLCMDIDSIEKNKLKEVKEKLKSDSYVFSFFVSAGGSGLSVIFKIHPTRHLDAFKALESYIAEKYDLFCDRSCKDVSRARFVSSDPDLYINEDSEKYTNYLPKSESSINRKKIPNVVTGRSDMDHIINQIIDNNIDITESSYPRWLEIGFSIAEEFGEHGRQYYHSISQFSNKYNSERCDRQYAHCLRSGGTGEKVSFGTFLYRCKEAGISIVSEKTRKIVTVASMSKMGKRGLGQAIQSLEEMEGIPEDESREIVEKVYAREDIGSGSKLSRLESLEIFLNSSYNLKRNEITRFIENDGQEIDTTFSNSVWIRACKEVDEKTRFEEIDRIIHSDFTEDYNPIQYYIEHLDRTTKIDVTGTIDALSESINTDTGMAENDFEPFYVNKFMKKWLVGMIASVYGNHCPLLLALTGGQDTGKTEFFRRLLPEKLQNYYAESKLDSGKDDEILMCQKLIIMDDEFGGKSKVEAKKLKEITSKQYFTLREPYGRKNVRLRRLAVMAGTSNEDHLINDPTGNRRIIPIKVISIDHGKYNAVDKDKLLLEAYRMYKSGFTWNLNREEKELLKRHTYDFEHIRFERELILRFFSKPENQTGYETIEFLTASEIKYIIDKQTNQRTSLVKIGQELKALGFEKIRKSKRGSKIRCYEVVRIKEDTQDFTDDEEDQDEKEKYDL